MDCAVGDEPRVNEVNGEKSHLKIPMNPPKEQKP
jgi:hypothetical protein